ncbi:MAG: DUF4175 family protein [Nitrospinales bacterium]
METGKTIETFLDRVRREQIGVFTLDKLYLLLAVLTCGYLVGNLAAYYAAHFRDFFIPYLTVVACAAGYILVRYLASILTAFSRDDAALLVESRYPDLNNALINSWQLQKHIEDPKAKDFVSISLIRELVRDTSRRIEEIQAESVVSRKETARSRNLFFVSLLLTGLVFLALPDFFSRGYNNFAALPPQAKAGLPAAEEPASPLEAAPAFAVEDIRLKFNYPAYTKLKSEVVDKPEVHVFPGTEVQVRAKSNLPIAGADLLINRGDEYALALENQKELSGSFMVDGEGFYQFRLKTAKGKKVVLPAKYPITLKKDHLPKIILFPANPKPVYFETDHVRFFYEGYDDFGIGKINLVIDVNGKMTSRPIKNLRGTENQVKSNYAWNLAEMNLQPGDEVQFYLEIYDNDNVLGPKMGLSEMFSFTLFDTRRELEDLVNLQDELVDKMIVLLSNSLIGGKKIQDGTLSGILESKKYVVSNTDLLIDIIRLAQRIVDQAELVQSFPQSYMTLLNNIISGLNGIREEQIELLQKLNPSVPQPNPVPVGFKMPLIAPVNQKLVQQLERDILFLVKIANRQKFSQAMDMGNQLSDFAESLRKEFERIKNQKQSLSASKIKKQLAKMQELLKNMMEKLARQTQGLPDEFLNPDAFQSLDLEQFTASMENIMDLVKQGKIDKALDVLDKLTEDLNTLTNQLNEMGDRMDDLVDMQIMKKIDQSIQDLLELEKKQKKLLEKTTQINQSLRSAQLRQFEDKLKEFFESLKKDVNEIQSIFRGAGEFLDNHPALRKFNELLDREARLAQEIQELRQATVDASQSPGDLQEKFKALNEAEGRRANLIREREALRLKAYDDFKSFLPQFLEKYNGLEELAKLFDLKEFNALFKNTYPFTLRWQHNLRMILKPDPGLSARLNADLRKVRALNAEISKKLGTLSVSLEKEFDSLITEANKTDLKKMAKKQGAMRSDTNELSDRFEQMSRMNPSISRELSANMSKAGKYMKMAENNLSESSVPESIDSETKALQELVETREMLKELKNSGNQPQKQGKDKVAKLGTGKARDPRRGGSFRMQRERVDLPSEDQYQAPKEFRSEILKAMKRRYPQKYKRFVTEYYMELVK